MKFVVIPELRGRWRWELRKGDQILATSSMSFGSQQLALVSIQDFRSRAPRSPLFDPSGNRLEDEPNRLP